MDTIDRIIEATTAEDIFGALVATDRPLALKKVFKMLAREVHPDLHQSDPRAKSAMQRLSELHDEAGRRLVAGLYGTTEALPAPVAPSRFVPQRVKLRGKTIELQSELTKGDIAQLYTGTVDAKPCIVKVAQHATDNDLLENEARVLREIWASAQTNSRQYFCELQESFLLKSKSQTRRANALDRADGFVSIAEVAKAYPAGLDYRDAAWMFKRTLSALWYLHGTGNVHGSVLPEHVLINPKTHGAKLVDLCYAVKEGQPARAISGSHRDDYPPEVLSKAPLSVGTDIFMVAKMFRKMLLANSPPKIVAFLRACELPSPTRRPNDAGALHQKFDELLGTLAGPRKFREFAWPKATE